MTRDLGVMVRYLVAEILEHMYKNGVNEIPHHYLHTTKSIQRARLYDFKDFNLLLTIKSPSKMIYKQK